MSKKSLNTQVLIVGAGPTGLMAANQLFRFGIDFIIVDLKSGPTIESRAIAVTARSMELYQQMGLSDYVVSNGKKIISVDVYTNGKKRIGVKIGEIGKGLSEFSYLFSFEQSKNETLLSQNLENNDVNVLWNHEFIRLNEFKHKIEALLKSDEEEILINADYVIGCEGARSPIRHQLNFSFKGGTYEQLFFVADVVLDWSLDYQKLALFPGNEHFCAFLPLADEKCYRILGTLPKHFMNPEGIEFEDIQKVILKTMAIEAEFEKVNWFSIYKLHHRAVEEFRKGRVFLAGDSAHIHSPAGGQGMNTGLQDAYNLAWKLAFVLKGFANENLLETYNEERLPFAKWLLKFTDRGFTVMTSTNPFIRFFRKYIAFVIGGIAFRSNRIRKMAFTTISQIGYSYKKMSLAESFSKQGLSFKAGDRLPFFENDNIYLLLNSAGFQLVHIAKEALSVNSKKEIKNIFSFPMTIIEQDLNGNWIKQGVKRELFILVRPDNYVALIFDSIEKAKIENYLNKYFK